MEVFRVEFEAHEYALVRIDMRTGAGWMKEDKSSDESGSTKQGRQAKQALYPA